VTDVLVLCSAEEPIEVLDVVNAFIADAGCGRFEPAPARQAGGNKALQADVLWAAFSAIDLPGLIAYLRAFDWTTLQGVWSVQLLAQDEQSYGFGLVEIWRDPIGEPWKEAPADA
jgi:hypothetical protein